MTTEFNLLPADYASRQRNEAGKRRLAIVLTVLALVCAAQFFACALWRLDVLKRRYDEAVLRRDEALAVTEALAGEKRRLDAQGERWRAIAEEAKGAAPVLDLLTKVSQALPETGRLEYLLVDAERCRVDALLPDLSDAAALTRRLGSPRGYGPFAAGGRRSGRSGLPLFRFDALKRKER